MAAIITDDFRRNSTAFLINDIKDQNNELDAPNNVGFEYFIGIGKSDSWDNDTSNKDETDQNFSTPLPKGDVIESKEVLDNLIGALAVQPANAYNVIPRVDWSATRRYKRWNENDSSMFDVSTIGGSTYYPCYAIYANKIYICLDNDSNDQHVANGSYVPGPSSVAPSGDSTSTSARAPNQSDDGYIWAYVADLDSNSKFNTDQFVSITPTPTGTADDATNTSGGIVYGFEIVSPGVGVSGTDFKLVLSKTSTETATNLETREIDCAATISAGGVIGITAATALADPGDMFTNTGGTTRASVVPAVGTSATTMPVIRALVSPINGFGFKPTQDLPSYYAGLAVSYNDNTGNEIPTSVSYRQISVLRNPTRNDDDVADPVGDGYTNLEVYNALRRFKVSGTPNLSSINQGDIITDTSAGLSVGAKAFVDYVDDTNKYIYFHQNESALINQNDFVTPNSTDSKITIGTTEYTTVVDADTDNLSGPEYTPRTGEVIFLENRKPIQRAASQNEEIKLVIQF